EQLAEAETVIQSMVDATKISSPGDTAAHSDFLLENTSETSAPEDIAKNTDSWKQILEANHFIPVPYKLDGYYKGSWRGWKFFFHTPNGGVIAIDIANDKEEMFSRCTEVDFGLDLGDEDKIYDWTRGIINQIEDFCPGQLSLFPKSETFTPRKIEIEEELSSEILERLQIERNKANDRLNQNRSKKHDFCGGNGYKMNKKEVERLDREIDDQYAKLEQLQKFSQFRVGQTVCHKRSVMTLGKIIKLEFSQGGMPLIWVKYFRDGELEKTPNSELVSMIFVVDVEK
uniref:hypothetical protein n=1 Tax=Microcoleus sp. TaxID=44472 RepID=UPI00403E6F75